MDKEWLKTNLDEAIFWIENAKKEIDTLEESDDLVAQQLISEAYIKLNYAWNSRGGPDPNGKIYDELIKYPKEMDIFTEKRSILEAFRERIQPPKETNS